MNFDVGIVIVVFRIEIFFTEEILIEREREREREGGAFQNPLFFNNDTFIHL